MKWAAKYKGQAPDWIDIGNAIDAIRTDAACETRIVIRQSANDSSCFHVVVETYTDFGAALGIAREKRIWSAHGQQTLCGCLLAALHNAYQRCYELAHVAPHPLGKAPPKK